MSEIELRGLPGTNPLGFMAALGAQVALAHAGESSTLHWTDTALPHAVLGTERDLDAIATDAMALARHWLQGVALGSDVDPKLQLDGPSIRAYMARARSSDFTNSLAWCLLAEDSFRRSKPYAEPTDLYFTSGNMAFVSIARAILDEVQHKELVADMSSPWQYKSDRPTLMWDVLDDRQYALRAVKPSDEQKLTNQGAEALAVLGLSRFPCYRTARGTVARGCSGRKQSRSFVWPLWQQPSTPEVVKTLITHASAPIPVDEDAAKDFVERARQYTAWGITRVLQSQIRRTGKGYGAFGPPRVIWQRD